MLPKAPPMITPTARSITFPLNANSLNSSNRENTCLAGFKENTCLAGFKSFRSMDDPVASSRNESQGQPRRQGSPGRQLDDAETEDVGMLLQGVESRRSGDAVEVDDADCLSPLVLAADIHLGNVDSLVAQGLAYEADQARAVQMSEDEKGAVHVGVEPVRTQAHQAQKLLAEEGAGGHVSLSFGRHLALDHGAEIAWGLGRALFDFQAPLARQRQGIDQVHGLLERLFHQPRGKARRDQLGVLVGHLTAVNQARVLERSAVHLGMDHA